MDESSEVLRLMQVEQDKIRTKLHSLISDITSHNLAIETKLIKLEDKMEVRKPCDLHVTSMKDLNDSVARIEIINSKTQGQLEGFMALANRILEKVDKDVYGDGGLISKANKCNNQINLQWGVLMLLLAGAISLFVWRH